VALVAAFALLRPTGGALTDSPGGITSESNLDSLVREAADLPATLASISDSMAQLLKRVSTLPVAMPTEGWLSSRFANSRLHPILGRALPHRGIDVAAPLGSPVSAAGAGRVSYVGRSPGYGLMVEIDHGDGLVTRYAHCSRAFVRVGEQVFRGTRIAAVGNSGLSTGPHLHYEVLLRGSAIDPLLFQE
jgi:murein DD-endopeptidase MepM/ murein hydrolase activator NlpD